MANFCAPRRSTTGWGRGHCPGEESRVACAQVSRSTREDVGKTVARQCGTHSYIFSVFLWDSPHSEAVNARAHRGVKRLQKKAQKRRGGGLMDDGKAYEDIRGKKREGKGGGGWSKVNS